MPRSGRSLLLVLLLVLMLALLASTIPAAADVTGRAFRDYNANGARDAREPGIAGVVVNAYDASGALAGDSPQTTAADGSYAIGSLAAGPLRIEFQLPTDSSLDFLQAGVSGVSSVRFASDGETVDAGFNNPAQYCQDDPNLVTSCYLHGDQSLLSDDVMVMFPYSAGNGGNSPAPGVDQPPYVTLAIASDIGPTWGLAYQRASQSLFAGAFMKRHTTFGPGGTGAIYRISGGSASLFLDLNALFGANTAGVDPHPSTVDLERDNGNNGVDFGLNEAWDAVGKRGLGDLDISDDGETLWAINLADRRLYEIPIGDPPTVPAAADVNRFDLPLPASCVDAAINARPFGLAVHDDVVYVGTVCTAETTQNTADLRAYVHRLDGGSFTEVLSFPLNHPRGCAVVTGCAPAAWNPWSPTFQALATGFSGEFIYPQPWLTDIEFINGAMVLGLRDRYGDQAGTFQLSTDPADTALYAGDNAGDLLCATPGTGASAGTWTIENNGTCAGVTSGGAGNAQGPGGGEFFFRDDYPAHEEISLGGLVQVPGFDSLALTIYDPIFDANEFFDGGILWLDGQDGTRNRAYRVYDTTLVGTTFAKGGGLGDLEAMCMPAPLELSHRLWCDADKDGVQDAGEAGIAGVNLRLQCGGDAAVVATTGPDGIAVFDDAAYGAINAGSVIPRFASCDLSIDTGGANGATMIAACGTASPSPPDQGGGDPNADLRDSDGTLSGGFIEISIATGGPGANDHTVDQGIQGAADLGDAPDSYGTTTASDGPVHPVLLGFHLGAAVDDDPDGQPTAAADGDDANGATPDDEDGVTIVGGMPIVCTTGNALNVTLTNSAGASTPRLDAWIDWNGDGDFDHPAEHLFGGISASLSTGANALSFDVPCGALAQALSYGRFRLSSTGALLPTGAAINGEVEDYAFPIKGVDFGDAPDTYGTTRAMGGPQHAVIAGYSLGASVDVEPDGQPNMAASGDGADEDGVVVVGGLPMACTTGNELTVALTDSAGLGAALLDAWIDWNGDGDFDHPAEHLFGGISA
ncbi:MAG: GEVED domain-containing protein, partial [Acidobacteriota bacterium]